MPYVLAAGVAIDFAIIAGIATVAGLIFTAANFAPSRARQNLRDERIARARAERERDAALREVETLQRATDLTSLAELLTHNQEVLLQVVPALVQDAERDKITYLDSAFQRIADEFEQVRQRDGEVLRALHGVADRLNGT